MISFLTDIRSFCLGKRFWSHFRPNTLYFRVKFIECDYCKIIRYLSSKHLCNALSKTIKFLIAYEIQIMYIQKSLIRNVAVDCINIPYRNTKYMYTVFREYCLLKMVDSLIKFFTNTKFFLKKRSTSYIFITYYAQLF